ncbi:uncharacterized protein LOC108911439 [Anoplophora glabripennis]|uniref:uncharacterized protein LOC108911439 n=1 Tax=Anoplophora glabripennis TaxID=217634 RepID=UPI0008743AD8|nr:uncharacterized protein LOC108911439 [Anoplophora glabripennis]
MIARLNNDNEQYKCGRCQKINCEKYSWIRNNLFEELAQNLSFPCSYPPCTEILPWWHNVKEHEGSCRYKTVQCPLSDDCTCFDGILVDHLEEHLTDKHKANIKEVNTAYGWKICNNYDYIYFVKVDDQYFFFYIKKWDRIAVLSTRLSRYSKFNVKLKLEQDDIFAFSFENLLVIPYNNNINNIDINDFCNKLNNKLTNAFDSYYDTWIWLYLTFITDPDQEDYRQSNVEVIRKALMCPYCVTYMVAPIFSCVSGHTICKECKSKMEKCPTCQASLDGPRIYTLEEAADDVKIPCQFNINGCPVVGNISRLNTHEPECSFTQSI